MSVGLSGAGGAVSTPYDFSIPTPQVPSAQPPPVMDMGNQPFTNDMRQRLVRRPITIVGVRGASISNIKRLVRKILKGTAGTRFKENSTVLETEEEFEGWLKENEDFLSSIGSDAMTHKAADGVFLTVGQVYVATNKPKNALIDSIVEAMQARENGGKFLSRKYPIGFANNQKVGKSEGNPRSAYIKAGCIILLFLVLTFAGFDLELKRQEAKLEWLGLAAPRHQTMKRVRNFYREYNPERLEHRFSRKLTKLVDAHIGNEKVLFEKLRSKYATEIAAKEASETSGKPDRDDESSTTSDEE